MLISRYKSAVAFLVNFSVAVLFLVFGPYATFAPQGYIDPWFYTGYFTHFSYLMHYWGVTYYVSRLPWILPGVTLFHMATPATATVLLHSLTIATGSTALYLTVACHYGKSAAVLACIALITNPYFMAANCWDYPDGPAIAYALAALGFFLRPTRGRIPNDAWGGVFLALSGYANLAALPALAGIMVVPLWRHRRSLHKLLRMGLQVFCGGTAITLLLVLVSKAVINYWQFFWPQVFQTYHTANHPAVLEEYVRVGTAWMSLAYRLSPHLFLLLTGAAIWLRRPKPRSAFLEAYLAMVATCALFSIAEWGLHSVGLQVEYRSSYILAPLMVLAGFLLGECVAAGWKVDSPTARWSWMLAAGMGTAQPFCCYGGLPQFHAEWTAIGALALLVAGCVAALRPGRIFLAAATCCLIFGGLFIGPATDSGIGVVWWKRQNAAVFQSLIRTEGIIDANLASRRARFWYDKDETPHHLYDSACSLYLGGYFDFTKRLASAPLDEIAPLLSTTTTLVHLTQNPGKIAWREALLLKRGAVVENERHWQLPSAAGDLYLVLEDIKTAPSSPLLPASR
jgi:hypothetical protein